MAIKTGNHVNIILSENDEPEEKAQQLKSLKNFYLRNPFLDNYNHAMNDNDYYLDNHADLKEAGITVKHLLDPGFELKSLQNGMNGDYTTGVYKNYYTAGDFKGAGVAADAMTKAGYGENFLLGKDRDGQDVDTKNCYEKEDPPKRNSFLNRFIRPLFVTSTNREENKNRGPGPGAPRH